MSVTDTLLREILSTTQQIPTHVVFGRTYVPHWWIVETNNYLQTITGTLMAKKGVKKTRNTGFDGVIFVNIAIGASERKAVKTWCADCIEHMAEVLPEYLTDGYKFSLKWDENNETFIVSMTCSAEGHPNEGKCLVSRSDNWLEAIALNIYKTRELSPSGVWPDTARDDSWG